MRRSLNKVGAKTELTGQDVIDAFANKKGLRSSLRSASKVADEKGPEQKADDDLWIRAQFAEPSYTTAGLPTGLPW